MSKQPGNATLATVIVCSILIGFLPGFALGRYVPGRTASASETSSSSHGEGHGGGGRTEGASSPASSLSRTVRALAVVEEVQNQGLTARQKKAILPILKNLEAVGPLADESAKSDADAIDKLLTPAQKSAVESVQPQRGGGSRHGGRGRASVDPTHPFAAGRGKQALEDLIAVLGGGPRK